MAPPANRAEMLALAAARGIALCPLALEDYDELFVKLTGDNGCGVVKAFANDELAAFSTSDLAGVMQFNGVPPLPSHATVREHMNALEGKAIRDKRNINIVCNPRNTTIESIMSAANRQPVYPRDLVLEAAIDLAVLGWDDDSDDEEETEADRALMERLEAQFQAHAAATASQRAPAPAAAPAPPPAVTVTTMPAAIQLSPEAKYLEECFETLEYGDAPDAALMAAMKETSGMSTETLLELLNDHYLLRPAAEAAAAALREEESDGSGSEEESDESGADATSSAEDEEEGALVQGEHAECRKKRRMST